MYARSIDDDENDEDEKEDEDEGTTNDERESNVIWLNVGLAAERGQMTL